MRQRFRVPCVSALTCAAVVAAGTLAPVLGQSAATTGSKRFVVIGCIKPAVPDQPGNKNAELTITDYRGGPAPTFRLDPNDVKLTPWANYTVELTGTLAAGSSGTGPNAIFGLNVEKVSVISRGCKLQEPSKGGENK